MFPSVTIMVFTFILYCVSFKRRCVAVNEKDIKKMITETYAEHAKIN